MTLKIIDVSSHQEHYKVGTYGEDGVIIKATQGGAYTNPYMNEVARQAIAKSMPYGLYHYAGGRTAKIEADYFVNCVAPYFKEENKPLLILDWEAYQNSAYGHGEWCDEFVNRVNERLGVTCVIYGNSGDVSQMSNSIKSRCSLWLAGYPYQNDIGWNVPAFPYSHCGFSHLIGWQYSSNPIDRSVFYVSREEWMHQIQIEKNIDLEEIEEMKIIQLTSDGNYYGKRYPKNSCFVITGDSIRYIERPDTLTVLKKLGTKQVALNAGEFLLFIQDMDLKIS
ncbi:GH25 family lysozyme [Lactococcus lactis]|uniref:GH25 family lysozyme n=1 Tax=Lactococcus lactis TaxID=1358 RepID=UPI001F5AC1FF|nr:GH25 family lysozyme [Lactococcus lactis]